MPDHHTIYVTTIVVIIVIFLITLLGIVAARCPEKFTNSNKNKDSELTQPGSAYFDPYVPPDYVYLDMTNAYGNDSLLDTPLQSIMGLQSKRSPYATQVAMNWWDTQ